MLCDKTLLMAAGAGYLVKLCPPTAESDTGYTGAASRVSLLARAECYVQFVNWDGVATAPIAPAGTPAPGAGTQAAYIHLLANERVSRGLLGSRPSDRGYTHVRVWAIAAGDLVVDAE